MMAKGRRRADKRESKLPKTLFAEASVKSTGGVSLFDYSKLVTSDVVGQFYSKSELVNQAVTLLRVEGFDVLQINPITINIAGHPSLFEKVFKTKLFTEERPVIKKLGEPDSATFIDTKDTEMSGFIDTSRSPLADVLEGVAIEEPVYFFAPSVFPPPKLYWHLNVPADVSVGLNADRAHRRGYTGKNVKVVMVDSGHYLHPFFVSRGYKVKPTVLGPGTANPDRDEHGHGTGESANVFAIAPDVDFTMVKINFVNSIGAFNAAVALNPHIISCSWGSSVQFPPLSAANQALAAAIANAVSNGINVIFSGGNGQWGFPAQHPDCCAIGGCYMRQDGTFEATPYASGFASNVYPGRNVPDCCGLVGLPPRAQYIMLPVEPGDTLDTTLSGGNHPVGDETAGDDGWAAFSGTSAAAPQIAGVCALMKQACPRLGPAAIKSILMNTSRDVTAGNSHPNTGGQPATPGVDLATGRGLVDAYRATIIARFRCFFGPPIIEPAQPIARPAAAAEEDVAELDDLLMEFMK
jgi:hypothetical protein